MTATPPSGAPSTINTTDTSYITMKDAPDATLIGTHCEMSYCNQLDFLPFLCQSCHHTFCLDHRSETSHKCPSEGAWARRRRAAALASSGTPLGSSTPVRDRVVSERPCARPSCKAVIGTALTTGVHCDDCLRDYCLAHRLREEHDCKNLEPLMAGAAFRKQQAALTEKKNFLLDRFRVWAGEKKAAAGRALPKAKPSTAAQRIIVVNTLKKTAKGDDKLAADKRVYLNVEAEAATTKSKFPKGAFFYSKDWVVGRMLDAAAKAMQIENVNNQSSAEDDKLRVFHVEGGRVLEFNEKIGSALVSGNTIVLLRGVGRPPDLIDL